MVLFPASPVFEFYRYRYVSFSIVHLRYHRSCCVRRRLCHLVRVSIQILCSSVPVCVGRAVTRPCRYLRRRSPSVPVCLPLLFIRTDTVDTRYSVASSIVRPRVASSLTLQPMPGDQSRALLLLVARWDASRVHSTSALATPFPAPLAWCVVVHRTSAPIRFRRHGASLPRQECQSSQAGVPAGYRRRGRSGGSRAAPTAACQSFPRRTRRLSARCPASLSCYSWIDPQPLGAVMHHCCPARPNKVVRRGVSFPVAVPETRSC